MNAVGKLGSYISRSVYIVSGPFHPFGGAVDIIVVEQPDGSFKSSPWYVRFGKFQGVLKAKEKVVSVIVNGVEADFHMYLDHKGEAHFIREVDAEDEDSLVSPLSSGEDTDGQPSSRRPMKSKSCNYDTYQSDTATQIDASDGRILSRSNSRRSRILGFVLGRRSAKDNRFLEGENDSGSPRKESMESAEIAADLLEVKWSRSMVSSRRKNDGVGQLTTQNISERNGMKDVITGVQNNEDSVNHDTVVDNLVNNSPLQHVGSLDNEKDHSSCSVPIESTESVKETGMEISCSISMYVAGTSPIEGYNNSISQMLCQNEKLCVSDGGGSMSSMDAKIEACSGEQLALGDLQKTDITLQDKHQLESCSNSLYSSFGKDNEKNLECDGVPLNQVDNGCMTKIFSERVSIQPLHGSVEGTESQSFSIISSLNSPNCQPLLEKTTSENGKMDESVSPLDTIDYPVGSCLRRSSPEELFFGELDDMKGFDGVQREEPISQRHEGECEFLVSQIICEENNGSALPNNFSKLSGECSGSQDLAGSAVDRGIKLKMVSSDLNIHDRDGSQVEEVFRVARSLPNMPTHDSDLNIGGVTHSLERTPDSYSASLEHTRVHEDVLSDINSEADNDHKPSKSQQLNRDVRSIENLENGSEYLNVGTFSEPFGSSPKSWKSWSLTSNRSRSMKLSEGALGDDRSSIVQNVSKREEDGVDDERGVPKLKVIRKQIRTTTPTTEELKSLKLKEGLNTVEFTFSTPMLGKQQVEARIHLWKWDSRIVISDVDGTITRSDLLGQVMPWVGVDWSQTGVAHLFSAIKENGYHVLFLSARAISQAYHTRQFLENLKQDGKALPEGPVVISPDGLFPSLYREVVRRAPHEFKISCLEAIKALFPPDRNPFYAGFGNRDTDEISYLKVGIPKGKIFIINPKGEIVVNRRVDRNSYTSLHAIVDDMFPLMSSSEQEDFNSWNYWKLPIPSDI